MLNPYIKTFIKVAECGSFSSASEQLFVSKVSVMNQMNTLEASIGVRLFERTHQGIVLTDAGKSFQKNAKKITRLSENAVLLQFLWAAFRKYALACLKEALKCFDEGEPEVGASMMRPCNGLVELCEGLNGSNQEYNFSIVPFNDDIDSLNTMLQGLGDKIDCFVSPCGSMRLLMNYSFLPLGLCKCEVAMSKKHPLAKKAILTWEDFENKTLLLMKRGESYVLDEMRDDIIRNHKTVNIVDFNGYYDISAFNMCEQQGYLMETLDMWASLHPSLATIPVSWRYEIPYGIIYAKEPSDTVKAFIDIIVKACVREV